MASSRRMPSSYNTSSYGGAGNGRDYTALTTWEAATDIDLVSASSGEVLECYDDEASFNDVDVAFDGATTNTNYFRVIKPSSGEGHDGTPNNGVFFSGSSGNGWGVFNVREDHFGLYDLIIQNTSTGNSNNSSVLKYNDCGYVKLVGCIFNSARRGTRLYSDSSSTGAYVINCISLSSTVGFNVEGGDISAVYFYNCTAADASWGFNEGGASTCVAKNCIACDCGTDFDGSWSKTTCYEGDATVFADQAGDDYHLDSSDTTARGNGTDLSSDGTYAFDDDIDGTTRSAWDIGADEYAATGWSGKILGVSDPAKVGGVDKADIEKITGV